MFCRFMLQGGDFTHASGIGGESIYGDKFAVRLTRSQTDAAAGAYLSQRQGHRPYVVALRTWTTNWVSITVKPPRQSGLHGRQTMQAWSPVLQEAASHVGASHLHRTRPSH